MLFSEIIEERAPFWFLSLNHFCALKDNSSNEQSFYDWIRLLFANKLLVFFYVS